MRSFIKVTKYGQVAIFDGGPFEDYIVNTGQHWQDPDTIVILKVIRNTVYALENIKDGVLEWTKVAEE